MRYLVLILLLCPPVFADDLTLLGQSSSSETSSAGAFNLLNTLRSALNIPKVSLSDDEKAALDRLKATMWKLAGPNERFDYGDLDDIIAQLSSQLGARVDQEISRRAAEESSRGIFPRIRGRFVARNVSRNYGSYYGMGMQQANDTVRQGLSQFLRETGCQVNVPDRAADSRTLTLQDLEQFRQDAEVLRVIKERAQQLGLPQFTFPNGMGWRDIEAIKNSLPPPNGRIVTGS